MYINIVKHIFLVRLMREPGEVFERRNVLSFVWAVTLRRFASRGCIEEWQDVLGMQVNENNRVHGIPCMLYQENHVRKSLVLDLYF